MNQQVQGSKKDKKSKKDKHDSGHTDLKQSGGDGDSADAGTSKKGSNAPRARKWDYGIKPDAKVVRLVETANVKRDIQAQFTHTEGDPLVSEFYEKGGDRHGLRVMMRRKLIKLIHTDTGAEFPVAYMPKPATAKEEGEAATTA